MNDDDLEDEVGFWLHMIDWWETNKNESAPTRMYQALELAKLKAGHMRAISEFTKCH